MPIYEYECQNCSHKLEAIQKFSDKPLTKCPECNKSKLTKMVSAPGFRLKGGGWYESDFKTGNKKYGQGTESTGSEKKKGSAKGSSKSGNDSKKSTSKSSSPSS